MGLDLALATILSPVGLFFAPILGWIAGTEGMAEGEPYFSTPRTPAPTRYICGVKRLVT